MQQQTVFKQARHNPDQSFVKGFPREVAVKDMSLTFLKGHLCGRHLVAGFCFALPKDVRAQTR
jgi:hypothetical protein